MQAHRAGGQRVDSCGNQTYERQRQGSQLEQRVPHGDRAHRHCDPHRSARHPFVDARARAAVGRSDTAPVPKAAQCLPSASLVLCKCVQLVNRPDGSLLCLRAENLDSQQLAHGLQGHVLPTSPARIRDVSRVARRALRGPCLAAGRAVGRVLLEHRAVLRHPAAHYCEPLLERAARRALRRCHRDSRLRARTSYLRAPHRRTRPGGRIF